MNLASLAQVQKLSAVLNLLYTEIRNGTVLIEGALS